MSDDSSLCFFPSPRAGCVSKIVTGKTDSALRLGMQRRRNRRKVEIHTWVGLERSSEENCAAGFSVKRAQVGA